MDDLNKEIVLSLNHKEASCLYIALMMAIAKQEASLTDIDKEISQTKEDKDLWTDTYNYTELNIKTNTLMAKLLEDFLKSF
tara:strand:- start:353 stop:595 length:243 start_codon:yes stop_codon:yes gene_type:complete